MFWFLFMFFYEIDVFYFHWKHVLLCLMSLEFIVISLLFLIMYFLMFSYSLYLCIVFMTFIVCEGVLGLGVLVFLIRCHGNDYISFFYNTILFLCYFLFLSCLFWIVYMSIS